MQKQFLTMLIVFLFTLTLVNAQTMSVDNGKSLYLVKATNGPGFTSPQEAVMILEKVIIPSFERLLQLQKENVVITGGVPLGDRAFLFIMQASSNSEVDKVIRSIPAWPGLQWDVTPLQSLEGRVEFEKMVVSELKKQIK